MLKTVISKAGNVRNIRKHFGKIMDVQLAKYDKDTKALHLLFLDVSFFYIFFYLYSRCFYPKQFRIKRGYKSNRRFFPSKAQQWLLGRAEISIHNLQTRSSKNNQCGIFFSPLLQQPSISHHIMFSFVIKHVVSVK